MIHNFGEGVPVQDTNFLSDNHPEVPTFLCEWTTKLCAHPFKAQRT